MQTSTIMIGDLRLNRVSRTLHVSNNVVFLRNKEFSLLECFMRNMGRVMSRTDILEEVWDRNICWSTNTVDVHVSRVRKALGITAESGFRVKTIYQHGYRLEKVD